MSDLNDSDTMRARLELRKRQATLRRARRGASRSGAPPTVAPDARRSGVAIVGVSGYFPGAMSVAEFWRVVDEDRPVITEIPPDRFDWRRHHDPDGSDPTRMRTRWGGFIPDIQGFDRDFFGVLPDEADLLDPQLRLLLMSVYHAIEDAGCAPGSLRQSRTGVYVASEDNEYLRHLTSAGVDLGINGLNHHPSMLANRLSYFFDLRGPSEIVNTMCASAAVALHRAVTALRGGEIDRAVVGAARVILRHEPFIALSRMKVLSTRDSVKSFGRDADGYIRAEGVASVMLTTLSRARAEGLPIYAVIRNTATNYNGRGGMSIAAPNVDAHVDVIRRCYDEAGVAPRDVGYIEAQGMGNQVGDIAEWEACNRALEQLCGARQRGYEPGFCRISTLKPMIGHMECASALGALFKVIRTFQTDRVHEILGLEDVNPFLDTDGRPCRLVRETETWPRGQRPRLAGIHSYGSGGNNAHLLIEEYPPPAPSSPSRAHRDQLVVVSARTEAQLRTQVAAIAAHVARHSLELASVAWTLRAGRDAFAHRAAFVAASRDDFLAKARAFVADEGAGVFLGVAADSAQVSANAPEFTATDLETIAAAWVRGEVTDWSTLPRDDGIERARLPTYPFDRRSCWAPGATAAPQVPAAPQTSASPPARRVHPGPRKKRVCIIGAGPSGLVMAKSLLEEGHEPVIFEKQRALGGLWLLNRHKTAGAYKKTRFQSSKFTSVFSDFYVDDITSTFYSVDDVITYLRRYADAFGLNQYIHYHSDVLSVRETQGRWTVVVRQGETVTRDEFDGVALCQGSFWDPNMPDEEGLEGFQGEVLHSGEYFDNARFRGKRVLVVGGGVSGMDIAEEAAEVASAVYWSRRTNKLILPRMVGYVPNDCQSPARLLISDNRYNIIDRLRRSMPDYFETYERSGILPSPEQFRANPVVHINDAIIRLVADGAVVATGDVERFDERGCVLAGASPARVEIDVVVFATGYKNFGAEDSRYGFLDDVSVSRDFAMGIFHARNPTLVNTAVLPIAFTGSFYFSEMVARWYAQVLSGAYTLDEAELAHRITEDHCLIMAPISSVLFGLKLGLLPRPEEEFREFWRLLNYPAFPMIYRLRGPHATTDASAQLERFRQLAYVKTETSDPDLRLVKERILAGLDTLDELLRAGEISRAEYDGALAQRANPLVLDWEAQYIKQTAPQLASAPAASVHVPDEPALARSERSGHEPVVEGRFVGPLHAALIRIMAMILRIDAVEVAPERNLSEYGFDSIALTGLAGAISREFAFIRLDPSVFLERPTLAELSDFLARKYQRELAERFQDEAHLTPSFHAAAREEAARQPTAALDGSPDAEALPGGGPTAAVTSSRAPSSDRIAVIGFGGRFPGAADVVGLWQNLVEGRSAITEVPDDRWSWRERWGDPHRDAGRTDCTHGAFLSDIDRFDPRHFGISPREAVYMDPQHRMLLEVAWETMECAGYPRGRLRDRKIGLFVGVEKYDYAELLQESGQPLDGHMNPGNAHSMLANRISRFFSWRGPSLAIDTACSSSFTALHLAVDQLRDGRIEMAFVGGVNVLLTPSLFVLNRQLGMLTSESVIRPFDREATGHLNGEGAALVLLKPLPAALRDGDTVYGVIRAAAAQHGGQGVHLMAPNPASHREVIEEALAHAALRPQDIDYIEAQGTGNPVTDRMELAVYHKVFSPPPPDEIPLGTIKGNLGHLGAASGVMALIRTILCLRNNKLHGVSNLDEVNWDPDDGPLPVRIVRETEDWPAKYSAGQRLPRRAGIHNYGFGGMNTHVIVEEYIEQARPEVSRENVFPLSARDQTQVAAMARRLAEFLQRGEYRAWGFEDLALDEIGFALQCGKEEFAHRAAVTAANLPELVARLTAISQGESGTDVAEDGVYHGVVDAAALRGWRTLLDEDERRLVVRNAVARRTMSKLAKLWVRGVEVPWDELYPGRRVRRVPLPSYPFSRERYWIVPSAGALDSESSSDAAISIQPAVSDSLSDVTAMVLALLARVTHIPRHELTPETPLTELGLDSLVRTQLVAHMEREQSIRLSVTEMQSCHTVSDLARRALERSRDTASDSAGSAAALSGIECLQRGAGQSATVWFHSALGTIQHYLPLARRLGREQSFYAVPARGVRDGERPLDDIIEMARHYRELIREVSSTGPLQLGGYSQGGVVAYEVARQLQEDGHEVDRLLLIDAPFPPVISSLTRGYHVALTFLNILDMSGLARPDDLASFVALDHDEQITELVAVGARRGLTYSEAELTAVIEKYAAILQANTRAMGAYQPTPLPRADGIDCHYLARRDPAVFFPATMTDLHEIEEQDRFYAQRDCVGRWTEWSPGITIHRTTAPDHFALMNDDEVLDRIATLCQQGQRAR